MSVLQKFATQKIVPDVIEVAPKEVLKVTYPSGLTVDGNELTPTQVKDEPNVEWVAESGTYYTLLMTDPDSREHSEVRHWTVVNIPGNNLKLGDHIVEYIGSGAPLNTGLHRYVFLLFKQTKGKQSFASVPAATKNTVSGRFSTKTRDLIADHNLKLVSGNFFLAQYDDYVPILRSQFT